MLPRIINYKNVPPKKWMFSGSHLVFKYHFIRFVNINEYVGMDGKLQRDYFKFDEFCKLPRTC